MFRWLLGATLLLLVPLASQAEVTLTAMTWPPGQEMKPGVSVMIRVSGMEQLDEGAVQPKTEWHWIPTFPGDMTLLFRDHQNQPILLFVGEIGGPRTILLQIESAGLDDLVRCDFQYGEGGHDDPDPPPPPPPGEVTQVVVVWETDEVSSPQTSITIRKLKTFVDSQGIEWRMADEDQTDGTTGKTPAYLSRALQAIKQARATLPALTVSVRSRDGDEVDYVHSFPSSGEEAIAIVRKYMETSP